MTQLQQRNGTEDNPYDKGVLQVKCTHFGLSSVLVLGQVDPGDGAKGPEQLLQVCLPGVLRQICHTDGGIIIS